mgnify:CR=1 FL=1
MKTQPLKQREMEHAAVAAAAAATRVAVAAAESAAQGPTLQCLKRNGAKHFGILLWCCFNAVPFLLSAHSRGGVPGSTRAVHIIRVSLNIRIWPPPPSCSRPPNATFTKSCSGNM